MHIGKENWESFFEKLTKRMMGTEENSSKTQTNHTRKKTWEVVPEGSSSNVEVREMVHKLTQEWKKPRKF